jgi:hypothetical protein
MGRLRKERTEQEWLDFGERLLMYLKNNYHKTNTPRKKLLNNTKELHNQLKQAHEAQEQLKVASLVKELNELKEDYGDVWKAWVKTITQSRKDNERFRTFIPQEANDYFHKLMLSNDDTSLENTYKHLHLVIKTLGISNIRQFSDIRDFLSKYQNHNNRHTQESLHSENTDDFDFGLALQSIAKLLSKNEINSFHELNEALRKRVKENNKLEEYKVLKKYLEKRNFDVDELIKKERGY